jgi:excisionase family DNA binding protein
MNPRGLHPGESSLWKTRQVAEALGLSVSTVKRLVDAGELKAARTLGKHRLIPPSEALRFARSRNLPAPALERLLAANDPGAPASCPQPIDAALVGRLTEALRHGQTAAVRSILHAAWAGGGAVTLADALIRPTMEAIGHGWEVGALDVFEEHRATRLLEFQLTDLIDRSQRVQAASAAKTRPLAIGATPEDDPYTLPGLLCELVLREQGWDVMNLGPNLPMDSLAVAVAAHRPRLVWLSASHLENPERFVDDYARFYARATRLGTPVILGGQALAAPALRARLLAAGFGERAAHLAEFARRLHPSAPVPEDRPIPKDDPTDRLPRP